MFSNLAMSATAGHLCRIWGWNGFSITVPLGTTIESRMLDFLLAIGGEQADDSVVLLISTRPRMKAMALAIHLDPRDKLAGGPDSSFADQPLRSRLQEVVSQTPSQDLASVIMDALAEPASSRRSAVESRLHARTDL